MLDGAKRYVLAPSLLASASSCLRGGLTTDISPSLTCIDSPGPWLEGHSERWYTYFGSFNSINWSRTPRLTYYIATDVSEFHPFHLLSDKHNLSGINGPNSCQQAMGLPRSLVLTKLFGPSLSQCCTGTSDLRSSSYLLQSVSSNISP